MTFLTNTFPISYLLLINIKKVIPYLNVSNHRRGISRKVFFINNQKNSWIEQLNFSIVFSVKWYFNQLVKVFFTVNRRNKRHYFFYLDDFVFIVEPNRNKWKENKERMYSNSRRFF